MKGIYLIKYSVKGIKSLDELVTLSFYKKTITDLKDIQAYNIKGIYGMNGSGKSGIITSVEILKNILINPSYLNNQITQKTLSEIINKKTNSLYIEAEYVVNEDIKILYKYQVNISRNESGKYVIQNEKLSSKNAVSNSKNMRIEYEVNDGVLNDFCKKWSGRISGTIEKSTMNLLDMSSLCSLLFEKIMPKKNIEEKDIDDLLAGIIFQFVFGTKMHIYIDSGDEHISYILDDYLNENIDVMSNKNLLLSQLLDINIENIILLYDKKNYVNKKRYPIFEKTIHGLYEFLHIFKSDLKNIEIEKKINGNNYVCELIMVYDGYKINVEFESTGIKKLIKLYSYIREMVNGQIVFIDEFDSNLHDVYLCALLEYLMQHGQGQLCFTTHNVGPMDILRRNKNSIDFLSVDHKIYSWKKCGHYSPSSLYRSGMIEGSPFNVDAIDFIGTFTTEEE